MPHQMSLHLDRSIVDAAVPCLSGSQASGSANVKDDKAESLMVQHQGALPVPRDHRPVRQWMKTLSEYAWLLCARAVQSLPLQYPADG